MGPSLFLLLTAKMQLDRSFASAQDPRKSNLGWLLCSVLLSLPWLVPTHAQPWTSYHAEITMAVVALPLIAWSVAAGLPRFLVPFEAIAVAGLAGVPLLQLAFGLIDFGGDAWLAAVYLLGLAAAIVVGARAQRLRPWALPRALFSSFGIAAVASVPLMLAQWLDWAGFGTLLVTLPEGARLSANVGQPNQLATLLAWGLLALWWARLETGAHGSVLCLLAALLLAAVAVTQSRAGALEVMLLGGAAVVFRRQLRSREDALALTLLAAWFVLATIAWPPLNELLRPVQVATVQERLLPGTRLLHWRLFLDAVAVQPWFGWGWNQIAHAQVALAPLHPASHEVPQYAHNLLLDLLLWNGVPIGAAAGLALATWWLRQLRLAADARRVLLLLAVTAFLLHAMVELPHGYLLFLVPVGLMVGTLHVPMRRLPDMNVPRGLVVVPFAALILATVLVIRDYALIEQAWMAHRFRMARIGSMVEQPVPRTAVLSNLEAVLRFQRTEPRAGMAAPELELLQQVSQRYPGAPALFRNAWALALNGDTAGARRVLEVLCRIHSEAECARAQQAWLAKSGGGHPELAQAWPATD